MDDNKKRSAVLPPYNPDDGYNMGSGSDSSVPEGLIKIKQRVHFDHSDSAAEKGGVYAPCSPMLEDHSAIKEKSRRKSKTTMRVKIVDKKKK